MKAGVINLATCILVPGLLFIMALQRVEAQSNDESEGLLQGAGGVLGGGYQAIVGNIGPQNPNLVAQPCGGMHNHQGVGGYCSQFWECQTPLSQFPCYCCTPLLLGAGSILLTLFGLVVYFDPGLLITTSKEEASDQPRKNQAVRSALQVNVDFIDDLTVCLNGLAPVAVFERVSLSEDDVMDKEVEMTLETMSLSEKADVTLDILTFFNRLFCHQEQGLQCSRQLIYELQSSHLSQKALHDLISKIKVLSGLEAATRVIAPLQLPDLVVQLLDLGALNSSEPLYLGRGGLVCPGGK